MQKLERLYKALQEDLRDAVAAERQRMHCQARSNKLRARSMLLRGHFFDALYERLGSSFCLASEMDGGEKHCWSFLAAVIHEDSNRAYGLSFRAVKRAWTWTRTDEDARERLQGIIMEMNK